MQQGMFSNFGFTVAGQAAFFFGSASLTMSGISLPIPDPIPFKNLARNASNLTLPIPEPQGGRSDVDDFIDRNDLQPLVEIAATLAAETLPLTQPITYRKMEDPESGAEWVEIRAVVCGDKAKIRQSHRSFTTAWLASTPRSRALDVRLSLSFV